MKTKGGSQMAKMKPVVFVGGGKGGIGKSLTSIVLTDYVQVSGLNPMVIESDTSAPDVWKHIKDELPSHKVNLDNKEGWLQLIDICGNNPEHFIIVNTGARNQEGMKKFGPTFYEEAERMGRESMILWVIDRKKDVLELLFDHLKSGPKMPLHIIRNNHFGDSEKFTTFNDSDTRKAIENAGGKILDLSDLADRVTLAMNEERLSIAKAAEKMVYGSRAEILRWRRECHEMFAQVIR
jgi:hypothetical protein